MFDTPLAMDNVLLPDRRARNIMQRCITPIVVSAIFRAMWSNGMGFVTASDMVQQELTVHEENDTDETGREAEVVRVGVGEDEKEEEVNGEENGWRSGWRSRPPMARVGITTSSVDTRWEAETRPMTPDIDLSESLALSLSEPVHEHINQSPLERELFAKLKQEHDLAKAVKSDDAEVPVDLWDQAVCISPPSEVEKKALTVMRDFMLAQYRRRLWLDARKYLQVTHGKDWSHSRHTKVLEDMTAIQDILWRAVSNTWFEFPLGSRLIFFRFPARYRTEAKRGVRVVLHKQGALLTKETASSQTGREGYPEEEAPQVHRQGLSGSTCWSNQVSHQVFRRPKRGHRGGCPRLENSLRCWRKRTQRPCLGSLLLPTNCECAFANNRRRNLDERPGSR